MAVIKSAEEAYDTVGFVLTGLCTTAENASIGTAKQSNIQKAITSTLRRRLLDEVERLLKQDRIYIYIYSLFLCPVQARCLFCLVG